MHYAVVLVISRISNTPNRTNQLNIKILTYIEAPYLRNMYIAAIYFWLLFIFSNVLLNRFEVHSKTNNNYYPSIGVIHVYAFLPFNTNTCFVRLFPSHFRVVSSYISSDWKITRGKDNSKLRFREKKTYSVLTTTEQSLINDFYVAFCRSLPDFPVLLLLICDNLLSFFSLLCTW